VLLHGGGSGRRWWKLQPVAVEEKRAMIAMAFFTGIDGFDTWNGGRNSNSRVYTPTLLDTVKKKDAAGKRVYRKVAADRMVKDAFTAKSEDGKSKSFERYDAIRVLSVDEETGMARFQELIKWDKKSNYGTGKAFPVHLMQAEELTSHIRVNGETTAAMIEGMALVKPFEYTLRHGDVKIDVPAQEQFGRRLPVVRRVKLGPIHVLITYDPNVIYGTAPKGKKRAPATGQPREIVLKDFDNVAGRTLRLPADAQTRIFVLREAR
jgi:hypothetical protein